MYKSSTKTSTSMSFNDGSCYFRGAFESAADLIKNAETQLYGQEIKFDSMAAIGVSGLLVLPLLARHFNVPFAAIRKQSENCHDSYGVGRYLRGELGKRWILIDDFVSSGRTFRNAAELVNKAVTEYGNGFRTTFVGTYCYGSGSSSKQFGTFVDPNGKSKSLASLEFDGENYYVDAQVYRTLRAVVAKYIDREYVDPKGRAIKYMQEDYPHLAERVSLDELAMMAVVADREHRAEGSDGYILW